MAKLTDRLKDKFNGNNGQRPTVERRADPVALFTPEPKAEPEQEKIRKTSLHLGAEAHRKIKDFCTQHSISFATYLHAAHLVLAQYPGIRDQVAAKAKELTEERRGR